MQNFESVIEEFATKVVDPNNDQVVKYELKQVYRRRNINILINDTKPLIHTPFGVFKSIRTASRGTNLSPPTLYRYLLEQKDGYYYE